jgi:hypothetical protein
MRFTPTININLKPIQSIFAVIAKPFHHSRISQSNGANCKPQNTSILPTATQRVIIVASVGREDLDVFWQHLKNDRAGSTCHVASLSRYMMLSARGPRLAALLDGPCREASICMISTLR